MYVFYILEHRILKRRVGRAQVRLMPNIIFYKYLNIFITIDIWELDQDPDRFRCGQENVFA